MCYAIPGKVVKIDGRLVTVDYFGERKQAVNELSELKIGDHIYAQGGYVIKVIPEEEAYSILSVFKETFFELQDLDLRLSRLDLEKEGLNRRLGLILDKAAEDLPLKNEDLHYLLRLKNEKELSLLYKVANFLRQKHLKNSCCVHGIIEFSNFCSQGCRYCGISTNNRDLKRYRMSREEIIQAAEVAVNKWGFQALVLQSGEDPGYSVEELCRIVKEIKERLAVLIFISFGEVGIPGIQKLYAAGARGLLMRFETSNPKLYEELHPGRTLETRLDHLKEAYKLGYLIITGGLIGLPGQTEEDLLNDILMARELKTEMYSFGPFLPHPKTPLSQVPPPLTEKVLKVLSVARLADAKTGKILVTTGFETLDSKARQLGLMSGANSVMLNVTPQRFSRDYEIYPEKAHSKEGIKEQIESTIRLLHDLGRAPTDLGVKA